MDVFDATRRKWVWLSEKPHATGTLKNYCFPMARPMTVLESELPALEFKSRGAGDSEVTLRSRRSKVRIPEVCNVKTQDQVRSVCESIIQNSLEHAKA